MGNDTMPMLGMMTGDVPFLVMIETSSSVSRRSPALKIQRKSSPCPSTLPLRVVATASTEISLVPWSNVEDCASSSTANSFFHAGSVVRRKLGISTTEPST